jgi:hypothetical protein
MTEVFPWFFFSCKANARVMPAKTGHGPHSYFFVALRILCSMYCLFCYVPCIICVYMCTEQLPPGVATQLQLNKYIYHISNANLKFRVCQHKIQVTPIKLLKFISSPTNTNQMLVTFHTLHIWLYHSTRVWLALQVKRRQPTSLQWSLCK